MPFMINWSVDLSIIPKNENILCLIILPRIKLPVSVLHHFVLVLLLIKKIRLCFYNS